MASPCNYLIGLVVLIAFSMSVFGQQDQFPGSNPENLSGSVGGGGGGNGQEQGDAANVTTSQEVPLNNTSVEEEPADQPQPEPPAEPPTRPPKSTFSSTFPPLQHHESATVTEEPTHKAMEMTTTLKPPHEPTKKQGGGGGGAEPSGSNLALVFVVASVLHLLH